MSRTYRNFRHGVEFCNNCNKPTRQHTVQQYELCNCPDKFVEMEVKDYKYIWNDNYPYASEECDEWERVKTIDNGWTTEMKQLPKSTYYRYDVKAVDGQADWRTQTNAGVRKDAQKYFNTKLRQKTKQVLNDRTTPYEEMVFPVKRNQVDWEIW